MTRISVTVEDTLAEEFRRQVPARERNLFIREALKQRLALRNQADIVRASAGIWSSEGRTDSSEEIRALRDGWKRA